VDGCEPLERRTTLATVLEFLLIQQGGLERSPFILPEPDRAERAQQAPADANQPACESTCFRGLHRRVQGSHRRAKSWTMNGSALPVR
jgi:hypothetical protein